MYVSKRILLVWLSATIITIIIQISLGGYVRLTDSGLSMYDWHVVNGIIPPISDAEWGDAFKGYKSTPEYKKINIGMSLEDYKNIYYREYNHRILGRITGLIYVLPLFLFLFMGRFKWRESKIYLLIGLLYAGQGVLGWYMVQSGLVDVPHVSHFRLAAHLLLAFLILGLVFWKLFDTIWGDVQIGKVERANPLLRILSLFNALLTIQICWGAFMAGLKAGFVSDTFPLMFGYLFPPNVINTTYSFFSNFVNNSVAVHFTHRWFAFVVLGFTLFTYLKLKNISSMAIALLIATALQVLMGITVILMHINISMALIHQIGPAILLYISLFLGHKLIRVNQ